MISSIAPGSSRAPIPGFPGDFLNIEESGFSDSHLNVTSCVFEGGPFWIWADFSNGKNAWYVGDSSEFSGPGAGAQDNDWETRYYVN